MSTKLTTGEEANHFIEKVREKYLSKTEVFNLQDKTVTENGEVKADENYYGLNKVNVNVLPVMEPITVVSSGTEQTINPPSGTTGFSKITVNPIDLEDKTITKNGVYTSETKSGFGEITVDVKEETDLAYTYKTKKIITAEDLDGLTSFRFGDIYGLYSISFPAGTTSLKAKNIPNCYHVDLPDSLIYMADYTCYGGEKLTKISIPDGCVFADNQVFYGTSIYEFTFPKNITNVKGLYSNSKLKIINIPEGVTTISGYFQSLSDLYEINLPSTLTTMSAFLLQCSRIRYVTLPDSVTTITATIFNNCPALKSVSLPANITSTFVPLFNSCPKLKRIYVRGNSSCSTATLLGLHTSAQLNNADIIYLSNE